MFDHHLLVVDVIKHIFLFFCHFVLCFVQPQRWCQYLWLFQPFYLYNCQFLVVCGAVVVVCLPGGSICPKIAGATGTYVIWVVFNFRSSKKKYRNFRWLFVCSLGFQTPNVRRYLDPKNIPKTPSQEVFGSLGCWVNIPGTQLSFLYSYPFISNNLESKYSIFAKRPCFWNVNVLYIQAEIITIKLTTIWGRYVVFFSQPP